MSNNNLNFIIVGSGPAGSLLACYLAKRGYKVDVFELRSDMRKEKISAGKSINLAMSTRGLSALRVIGMEEEILKICIPMYGRKLHSATGELNFQSYSKDSKSSIYSVSRGELNCKLMTKAETFPTVQFHFNHKAIDCDLKGGKVTFENTLTHEKVTRTGIIMGCDGSWSPIRHTMTKLNRFDYSQNYITTGYKELNMPPNEKGEHRMDKNCLHIWPRGKFMMIALPNLDGSFTVTCFFPFDGEVGFDHLDSSPDSIVKEFFEKNFPDSINLMPDLIHDFKKNPTSSLVTIRCFPYSFEDKACLFGDACHAVVPFFGQGMNAAMEDVEVFDSILKELGDSNITKVFEKYQTSRKKNCDAIANMALENLVEMSEKTADKHFLFKKQVHNLLGQNFPVFQSRYEMISFSNIPYLEAERLGQITEKITDELIQGNDNMDISKIDLKLAAELIEKYLKPKSLY